MTIVLVQSLNKMHMKYVLHNKFRMMIFHDQKALSLNFKSRQCGNVHKNTRAGVTFWYSCRTGGLQLYYKEIPTQVLSCEHCEIFNNTFFEEHLQTSASVLLIIKLLIKYWTSADLFLIKNIAWSGLYYKGL